MDAGGGPPPVAADTAASLPACGDVAWSSFISVSSSSLSADGGGRGPGCALYNVITSGFQCPPPPPHPIMQMRWQLLPPQLDYRKTKLLPSVWLKVTDK